MRAGTPDRQCSSPGIYGVHTVELNNKVIIVTGASSGIGAAAATLFAAEGACVVLAARRAPELAAVAASIASAGGRAIAFAGDVRDQDYADALVGVALKSFGGLDGAFNNAGTLGVMGPAETMTIEQWNQVMEINLTSAFLAAKAQIPAMRRRGRGSIVFTSSFVGFSNGGMPGMGAYAASKAGLIGLTQSLASDHAADGIRINALLPGGTHTPMGGSDSATLDLIANLHPMKRMASPDEIAQAALFLLSDRASFMTGSPMIVDGGVSVRL
jgi:NAD(P)-dependent dehydrogenase (short-subunit alcohol dehydrogenase family)